MFASIKSAFAWVNDKIRGWRTYIVGGVVAVASVLLEVLDGLGAVDISAFLPLKIAPFGTLIMSLVMLGLRKITSTPPGKKA